MDSSSDGTSESSESFLIHSSSTSEHQKESSNSDVTSHKNTNKSKRRYSFCTSEIEKIGQFDSLSERCNKTEEEREDDEHFNESCCISEKTGGILMPQVKWLLMSDQDDDKQSQQSGVSIKSNTSKGLSDKSKKRLHCKIVIQRPTLVNSTGLKQQKLSECSSVKTTLVTE